MTINSSLQQSQKVNYQIQVQGHVSQRWADWFGNMIILNQDIVGQSDFSTLSIQIADQAALLGSLQKLHNLGYVLLEIKRIAETVNEERSVK
jgi:uncharacterized protein YjfI (DUF2170 family)